MSRFTPHTAWSSIAVCVCVCECVSFCSYFSILGGVVAIQYRYTDAVYLNLH